MELFVADSESSSIRSIEIKGKKGCRAVVGGDESSSNLKAFGDEDGVGTEARLQHPLGVHFVQGKNVVMVADTYNHKIKVIDPFNNEIFSWLGSGSPGLKDGYTSEACFSEPSGLTSIFDHERGDVSAYIADCVNN